MSTTDRGGQTPPLTAINRYADSLESGNARVNARSALESWAEWLSQERGVEDLQELEVLDCRRYATHLKQRVSSGEIKGSTAQTYYAHCHAFGEWSVAEELLNKNPFKPERAKTELPEDTKETNQQFWPEEQRKALLKYVQERAHTALDDEEINRRQAFRDRALAYMLALSGVRGAEIVRDPRDHRRGGLRWKDLNLERNNARVLGKSREFEHAPIPEDVADVLRGHKQALAPRTNEWPVFPTEHRPTLASAVREQLEHGDELLQEHTLEKVLEEHDVVPPAITTDGARAIMQRLCEQAEIKVDGEYLKPHGGRRGVGHTLYQQDAELAQQALRHQSIVTTHERYTDIRAGQTANEMDEVLDGG